MSTTTVSPAFNPLG